MAKIPVIIENQIMRRSHPIERNHRNAFTVAALSCALLWAPSVWAQTLSVSPVKTSATTQDKKGNETNLTADAAQNSAPHVLISELRTQGPGGASDSFIELANNSAKPVEIGGWSLRFEDTNGNSNTQIPKGISIPAYGHFLLAGAQYSLTKTSPADLKIEHAFAGGVQLRDEKNRLVDAVGPRRATMMFREGNGLDDAPFSSMALNSSAKPNIEQFSCVRRFGNGVLRDSNDNESDFVIVSTSSKIAISTVRLGAPAPENLKSPLLKSAQINAKPVNISGTETKNASSTRILVTNDSISDPITPPVAIFYKPALRDRQTVGTNKTFGVLKLRCRLVNITEQTIKRLNFRVNGITNIGTSVTDEEEIAQTADVRLLPTPKEYKTDNISNAVPKLESEPNLWETTLDELPFQPLGGGFNSSVSVNLPKSGLIPGAACDLEWTLGVEKRGHYQLVLDSEHFHLIFEGDTESRTRSLRFNRQNSASGARRASKDFPLSSNSAVNSAQAGGSRVASSKTTVTQQNLPVESSIATAIIIFEGNTEDEFEPVEPTHSSLKISSFHVKGQTVALRFGGPLDPQSASDTGRYTVQINGATVELESAKYDVGSNTVSLVLPPGLVRRGDTILIKWVDLKDVKGGVLSGQAGPAKVS